MRQGGGLAPFLSQREPKEACALSLALAGRAPGFLLGTLKHTRVSGFGGSAATVKAKAGLAIYRVCQEPPQGQWEIPGLLTWALRRAVGGAGLRP